MANTFELISSVTVGSGGAATIDFTSIPSTYTDLCVKLSTRDTQAGGGGMNMIMTFNNSTASAYSERLLQGNGSSAASYNRSAQANETWIYSTSSSDTASTFANVELYIPNYAGSAYKSSSHDGVTENNATSVATSMTAGLWSNTAAINRITFTANLLFAQYSTAYIYGVKNA